MAYDDDSGRVPVSAYPAVGPGRTSSPGSVLPPDGLTLTLLRVTARALYDQDGADPAEDGPELDEDGPGSGEDGPGSGENGPAPGTAPGRAGWGGSRTVGSTGPYAVACEAIEEVDAEATAAWLTSYYARAVGRTGKGVGGGRPFPAVVIGSPHGAAAHLAAAMGAPWLPSGFEFTVRWPGGCVADPVRALRHGAWVGRRVLAGNPGIAVRQVHDPVLRGAAAGGAVSFFARWRRVPRAYREFLATRLAPDAPVLLIRDARAWPVFDLGGGLSFQLGSPLAGLEPEDYLVAGPDLRQALRLAGADARRWQPPTAARPIEGFAEYGPEQGFEDDLRMVSGVDGRRLNGVLYPRPAALSTAVAEVLRGWLAASGRADDRLAIECGRLLGPAQTARSGLVPYWCESALRTEIAEAEWWLAGSRPFRLIDVLVEPPGRPSSVVAPIPQWRALSWFARSRGTVDRTGLRCYPYGSLSARHAAVVLSGHADDLPRLPPLGAEAAFYGLAEAGRRLGLLAY